MNALYYVSGYIRGVYGRGRPVSNLVRYEETALELRFALLVLNQATIQRYTFLPSVTDLEKSFKVEVGWLS